MFSYSVQQQVTIILPSPRKYQLVAALTYRNSMNAHSTTPARLEHENNQSDSVLQSFRAYNKENGGIEGDELELAPLAPE